MPDEPVRDDDRDELGRGDAEVVGRSDEEFDDDELDDEAVDEDEEGS